VAKVRTGIIGASLRQGWAGRSHLPALVDHPDSELVAVCTTSQASADATKAKYNAKYAYPDYREMLKNPEVDAVVVALKVPNHYQPVMDAIAAGKHVYCEWPLGRNTAEAVEMAQKANAKGVRHMVGLQARANPQVLFLRDLIKDNYVGEMISCRVHIIRDGILARPSERAWQREDDKGANILTIPFGHTIDAFRYVVGDFANVTGTLTTQVKQWLETDTKKLVDVNAPDTVMISGLLKNGAAASATCMTVPYASSGYALEIYGREGTLIINAEESPQLAPMRIQGAKKSNKLEDLPLPEKYKRPTAEGQAANVSLMHAKLADAIRSGKPCDPSFDTAVEMHRFLDQIRTAAHWKS
jgi:predicted dehydrogenase